MRELLRTALILRSRGWPRLQSSLARLRAGKLRACRGLTGKSPHPVVDRKYNPRLARQLGGHWVGTNAAKDELYARLKLQRNGSVPDGWRHFPESYGEQYFKQLTAESVTINYEDGEEVRTFTHDGHPYNEALDLAVYNLAAYRLRRWNFAAIKADMLDRAEAAKTNVPVPKKEHRRRSSLSDD